jgi:hypothetical protein
MTEMSGVDREVTPQGNASEAGMCYGVCSMDHQLTRSILTNLRSIYLQLSQHQRGMA